jgi:hypothetical protein
MTVISIGRKAREEASGRRDTKIITSSLHDQTPLFFLFRMNTTVERKHCTRNELG